MGCLILTGITRTCTFAFGGLKAVFLTNRDNVTAKKNPSTNQVTGFTMTNSDKFFKFEAEPETSQLLEELQPKGSKFINQTVKFTLVGIDQVKREILEKVSLGKLTALCQYQDDTYYLAGIDGSGLTADSLSIDSGTAIADLNGAVVTLKGASLGYANSVAPSAVSALLA